MIKITGVTRITYYFNNWLCMHYIFRCSILQRLIILNEAKNKNNYYQFKNNIASIKYQNK